MRFYYYILVTILFYSVQVFAQEATQLPELPALPNLNLPNNTTELKPESLPPVSLPEGAKEIPGTTPNTLPLPPISAPTIPLPEMPPKAAPSNKVIPLPSVPAPSVPKPDVTPPKIPPTPNKSTAIPAVPTTPVTKIDIEAKNSKDISFEDKFKVFEQSSPNNKEIIAQVEKEANQNITTIQPNNNTVSAPVISPSTFGQLSKNKPPVVAATPISTPSSDSNVPATSTIKVPDKSEEYSPLTTPDLFDAYINERPVYDYLNQQPSPLVNKKFYGPNNKHLPKSFDVGEYSQHLFIAAYQDDIGTINALLEKGADINAKDARNGYTPLMYGVLYDRQKAYRLLISKGADLNVKDDNQATALHLAAQKKNLPAIAELIDNGANNFALDRNGRPPFYYADNIRNEYALIVLNSIADTNKGLLEAARIGSIVAVQEALNRGADIDYQNEEGDTAVLIAAFNNDLPMVNFLLAKGAYPEIGNKCLIKPIDAALANKNQEMVDAIETILVKNELDGNYPPCIDEIIVSGVKKVKKPKRTKLKHTSKRAAYTASIVAKDQSVIDQTMPPMDCDINANTIYRKAR